jgi:hypothetical protein
MQSDSLWPEKKVVKNPMAEKKVVENPMAEEKSMVKEKSMEEVISRLKAAAEEESKEDYQRGHDSGERWAKEEATPKQLRRLAKWYVGNDIPGDDDGKAGVIHDAINPAYSLSDEYMLIFWEEEVGVMVDEIEDYDFAKGFVEGVLEVWDSVKDRV